MLKIRLKFYSFICNFCIKKLNKIRFEINENQFLEDL